MIAQQQDCALDLMRHLPPQQTEKNLSNLIDLVPSFCEDLLSSVDQTLNIARDKMMEKDYLLCDYNTDGTDCSTGRNKHSDKGCTQEVPVSIPGIFM